MTNQDRAAMIDTALKKHEMNCCMFERGVQTLDDLLASREVLLAALQSQQAALVKCRDALMALDAETNPICEGNYCDSIDSAYTAARAAIAETERVIG